MKLILILPLALLTLLSCEKSNNTKITAMPVIPDADSVDIDNDSQFDFVIEYLHVIAYKSFASEGIIGEIQPLHDNELLYRYPEGSLFLKINDTIRKENNTNSNWRGFSATLIAINADEDKWNDEWSILSDLNSFYFLGIKLKGDTEKIGWILFDLNTNSGEISITDKELIDSDELIIQKLITDK